MECDKRRPLEGLLKNNEKAYLASSATLRKRKIKEEIEDFVGMFFRVHDKSKTFEQVYGRTFDNLVAWMLEKENEVFGDVQEAAYVPDVGGLEFVSEAQLKRLLERGVEVGLYPDQKILFTELKGSTTPALKEMYAQSGLMYPERSKTLPRQFLMSMVDSFVSEIRHCPCVSGVYLTGSLADGSAGDRAKDADVIVVSRYCRKKCPIRKAAYTDYETPDGEAENMDLFCFSEEDFEKLLRGSYRITNNMVSLLKK